VWIKNLLSHSSGAPDQNWNRSAETWRKRGKESVGSKCLKKEEIWNKQSNLPLAEIWRLERGKREKRGYGLGGTCEYWEEKIKRAREKRLREALARILVDPQSRQK